MIPFPGQRPDGTVLQDAGATLWAQDLAQVAASGFDAVDPTDSWLRIADLTPARRAEFMGLCDGLGLSVPALSTSRRSVIDPVHGDAHLAYSHRVIDCAAELGIGHVSFGLFGPLTAAQQKALWFWTEAGVPNPDDAETRDRAVTRIRDLARHAETCGVAIALEMYEDTYLGTAPEAVRFVTDVDHPSVRLNIDIGNLIRLHRPVAPWAEMIEICAPHAGYWHVKNYTRIEDPSGLVMTHPAPLLGGTINWRAAIERALDLDFASPFLVEHYGGDGLSVCAQNRDYLRQILTLKEARDDIRP
ncbi:sugar phosphate isomerase/epimerase family protein [Paracoccus nototheniae]